VNGSTLRIVAGALGALTALVFAGQALAFECFVEGKPAGAGSVGTVDIATNEFTPTKNNPGTEERPHGGFVTLDFGGGQTFDVFQHIPQGGPNAGSHEIPPVANGVQADCDGKGLGEIGACFAP
jgi:hypothetical protein